MKTKEKYELPKFDLHKLINHINTIVDQAPSGVVQLVIDLFCGAGGTSEGIEQAKWLDKKNSIIIIGINHDKKAIYSQAINHPYAYYTDEDIRFANLHPIKTLVNLLRKLFPQCPIIIWGSMDCTHHSGALGGRSRDADSRSLALDVIRYIKYLDADGFWFENVTEFESWGPLIEKEEWIYGKSKKIKMKYAPSTSGSESNNNWYYDRINNGEIGSCPIHYKFKNKKKTIDNLIDWGAVMAADKRFSGIYYDAWKKEIMELGYHMKARTLNAADYGVPQNRHRFFGIFMRTGWPIIWPEATHSKDGNGGLFATKKHIAVKTCLNFENEGKSVMIPGHIESDKTWLRLYGGLIKFVAGGKDAFMHQRNNGIYRVYSLELPARVVTTTGGNQEFVKVHFITKFNNNQDGSVNIGTSIEAPASSLTTIPTQGLFSIKFLDVIYGNGYSSGLNDSSPTVRTKDGLSLTSVDKLNFILNYKGKSICNDIDKVSPTIMTREKLALLGVKYFMYRAFSGGGTNGSIEKPDGPILTIPKSSLIEINKIEGWIGSDQYDNIGSSLEKPANTITAARHWHYLFNPQWFGHTISSEEPSVVIIARQDKAPLSMVDVERMDKEEDEPKLIIPVFETDSEIMIKVKEFMIMYDIYDIKKRMLMVEELLKIQSFPSDYFLAGSKTDQKKFIGNAVPPFVAKAIAESMYDALKDFIINKIIPIHGSLNNLLNKTA